MKLRRGVRVYLITGCGIRGTILPPHGERKIFVGPAKEIVHVLFDDGRRAKIFRKLLKIIP